MRVVNNIRRTAVKTAHYGSAVRRKDNDELFIVIDMFVGDGFVRIVDLASGKVLKIPESEEVILVDNAYVEVESNGFI